MFGINDKAQKCISNKIITPQRQRTHLETRNIFAKYPSISNTECNFLTNLFRKIDICAFLPSYSHFVKDCPLIVSKKQQSKDDLLCYKRHTESIFADEAH
jgi:hypothetical protein